MKNKSTVFTSRLLLKERSKQIKKNTAFKAKIMLENNAMRKEISTKVRRK